MSIKSIEKDPREFVICLYTRPNDSFPTKLDCCVNGHAGIVVEGQNCILPRFLVNALKTSSQFVHRPRPANENNENYETVTVHPTIDITEIDETYQSPEGIQKLLALSKEEKEPSSPFFRLRLGTKDLSYGDMGAAQREAEKAATAAVAQSPKAVNDEVIQLKAELHDKDKALAETNKKLDDLASKFDAFLSMQAGTKEVKPQEPEPKLEDTPEFIFEDKVYKTEAAMKTAMTKAAKAKEAESQSEEEAIEVEV